MIKLKQYSKHKPCYYCGASTSISREHAPPQMMFEAFDCSSITVPACDEHNNFKSHRDRAIITGLVRAIDQMPHNIRRDRASSKKVQRAIEALKPNYAQADGLVSLQSYLSDPPEGLDIPLPFLDPEAQLPIWIKQLTAALIWSAVGVYDSNTDWDGSIAWSPHFERITSSIPTDQALIKGKKNLELESYLDRKAWWAGWSAKPNAYPRDIFRFDLSFVSDPLEWGGQNIIFRHIFYDSLKWYMLFAASAQTVEILQEGVGARK